jgi:hypothetical protein
MLFTKQFDDHDKLKKFIEKENIHLLFDCSGGRTNMKINKNIFKLRHEYKFKEGNQDLKPVGAPIPPTAPTAAAESNPNKDILNKIAENTSNTNTSVGALIQAIYKLAQSMGGKTGAPPIIVNGQQKQDTGPSASQVAAANNDPIRNVRSQFAL